MTSRQQVQVVPRMLLLKPAGLASTLPRWTHSVSVCCWWRCVFESSPSPDQNAKKNRSSVSSGQPWCPSLEAAPVRDLLTVPAWVTSWSYWIEYKYRRTDLHSLFFVCTCSYNLTTVLLPLQLFSTVCSFVADFLSIFYPHQFMYMFNFLPSSVYVHVYM